MFMAILAFAYPLALPIPLVPFVVVGWGQRRRVREVRRLYRGRRSLLWLFPLGVVLAVPLYGVLEKSLSAFDIVVNTSKSLVNWGGDLNGWFPEPQFFASNSWGFLILAAGPLLYGAWLALRDQAAPLRRGLYGLFAFLVVFTVWFRIRDHGYYFHFKLLAFVAPVVLVVAVAGFARLRHPRLGYGAVTLLLLSAVSSARAEVGQTFDQLPKFVLELRTVDAALPPGRSIRLDIDPQEQNWTAFWLSGQPLCSEHPLLNTSYPHVPISRKADYILAKGDAPRPADAGPVSMRISAYTLYRAKPGLPGRENCSRRMVQTITATNIG
jgi:hypothetical protein